MAIKKRSGPKTTARKPAKKKAVAKRTAIKKTSSKDPARKKTPNKSAARKPARKKATKKKTLRKTRTISARIPSKRPVTVEPGPPTVSAPPVEEPSQHEEAIGIVTHYYSHLGVAVVQMNKGALSIGDTIHIVGHTTDISLTVTSMEYEHQHVNQVVAGQNVGIKITDHAREHDIVYLMK